MSGFENIQVAIDGPAGAGKGCAAVMLADTLGLTYLDTGAMYRAFAYHAQKCGYDADIDEEKIAELFESFSVAFEGGRLFLNSEDITDEIRTPQIDIAVSGFAVNPCVRRRMVALQQTIGSGRGIVMDGRDIGSVVLKDTPYKFYLDAAPQVRAERRYRQNLAKGLKADYEAILADIMRRDKVDTRREADPLTRLPDACYIDSSDMTLEEVVSAMLAHIKEEGKKNI